MPSRSDIQEWLEEQYPELSVLLCDGLEDAFIGLTHRFGDEPIACFDHHKCIEILMAQGMSEDDAHGWFEYNVIGAYAGKETPCFLDKYIPCKPLPK